MKLFVISVAFAATAFFAPLGDKCADCGSSSAHDEGNGEIEITDSVTHFSGDCTMQGTDCKPNDPCYVTGSVTVKNLAGGEETIIVTKPTGGTEEVGDGDSLNMQLIQLHTSRNCGTAFMLGVFDDGGASIGDVRYNCNACPAS